MPDRDPRPRLDRLRAILEAMQAPCATLFVPVDPAQESVSGAGTLRMRAAREALGARLEALDVDAGRRTALDARLEALRDGVPPPPDVRTRVLLIQEDAAWRFGLTTEEERRVLVGRGFAWRPLLREARREASFLVLAVSARRVTLYASTDEGRDLRELPRGALPASLEDALGHDLEARPALQAHSTRAHGRAATYHGQGGADDERRVDLERFHRVLATALPQRLDASPPLLVLAADRSHQAGLRAAAGERTFLAEGIVGSPEPLPSHELAAEAHARVARALAQRDAEEAEELEKARGRGKAVFGLQHTLEATATGRVRRLFVPAVGAHPGRIDASALRAVAPWADEDLSDELAEQTLRHGGEVVPWEPGHPPADGVEFAAELR